MTRGGEAVHIIKISRCLPEDLVGLPELAHLALERLDPRALVSGWTGSLASIALGLSHPVAQRLARAADLSRNRVDRFPLRAMLALMVKNHPHRALANLW